MDLKNTILDTTSKLGIPEEYVIPYGWDKAKISLNYLTKLKRKRNGKLVLITSGCNANKAGEGKTSTEIGLNDGLNSIGVKSIACLREPSLGVALGNKGPADGALKSKIVPPEINYHFTGDIHALTSTINLIAAMIDNTIYRGNELNIDPNKIVWNRAIDICDRSLRSITTSQDDPKSVPHHCEYVITVAHELSTIMTLSENMDDFINRANKSIVAYTYDDKPITVKDLKVERAMQTLMKDALCPNIVKSLEGNPVLCSGLPFANISCGTNSVIATKMGLKLADVVLTEAGFGSDLGGEKFLNIKCQVAKLKPDAIVAVTSCRSLKLHGGQNENKLNETNVDAVKRGICNLSAHIEHLKHYKVPIIVAINKFSFDDKLEIKVIEDWCAKHNIPCEVNESALKGAKGAAPLATKLMNILNHNSSNFTPLYKFNESILTKIDRICKEVYGAGDVEYSNEAMEQIKKYEENGYGSLPVCISKTPASLTDDPEILGRPIGFKIHIREVRLFAGSGMIVPLSGKLLMLPGLGKLPRASDDYYK